MGCGWDGLLLLDPLQCPCRRGTVAFRPIAGLRKFQIDLERPSADLDPLPRWALSWSTAAAAVAPDESRSLNELRFLYLASAADSISIPPEMLRTILAGVEGNTYRHIHSGTVCGDGQSSQLRQRAHAVNLS